MPLCCVCSTARCSCFIGAAQRNGLVHSTQVGVGTMHVPPPVLPRYGTLCEAVCYPTGSCVRRELNVCSKHNCGNTDVEGHVVGRVAPWEYGCSRPGTYPCTDRCSRRFPAPSAPRPCPAWQHDPPGMLRLLCLPAGGGAAGGTLPAAACLLHTGTSQVYNRFASCTLRIVSGPLLPHARSCPPNCPIDAPFLVAACGRGIDVDVPARCALCSSAGSGAAGGALPAAAGGAAGAAGAGGQGASSGSSGGRGSGSRRVHSDSRGGGGGGQVGWLLRMPAHGQRVQQVGAAQGVRGVVCSDAV